MSFRGRIFATIALATMALSLGSAQWASAGTIEEAGAIHSEWEAYLGERLETTQDCVLLQICPLGYPLDEEPPVESTVGHAVTIEELWENYLIDRAETTIDCVTPPRVCPAGYPLDTPPPL